MRWTVRLSYNPHDPFEVKYDEVHCCKSRSFLGRCKRSGVKLQEKSSKIGKSVESALSKRDKEKVAILESDLPEPVPSDPGLRPPNVTKSQIEYLAQIGPQQPSFLITLKTKRSSEITRLVFPVPIVGVQH